MSVTVKLPSIRLTLFSVRPIEVFVFSALPARVMKPTVLFLSLNCT